jgi:hypothetical protein
MKTQFRKSSLGFKSQQLLPFGAFILLAFTLQSCFTYYPISYYQGDIPRSSVRIGYTQAPAASTFYQSYFADKAADLAEQYELTDTYSYQSSEPTNYAAWGQNASSVSISVNNWGMNNWGYWNNPWNWNNPWGWNNWGWNNPWAFNNWGWNTWGYWNDPFRFGYPVYGGIIIGNYRPYYVNTTRFYRNNARRYRNERATYRTPSYVVDRGRSNQDLLRSSSTINRNSTINRQSVNRISNDLRSSGNRYSAPRTQYTAPQRSSQSRSTYKANTSSSRSSSVRTNSSNTSRSSSPTRSNSSRSSSSGRSNSRGNN